MPAIPPWIATLVALFLSIVTGIVLYFTFVVSTRQDLTTTAGAKPRTDVDDESPSSTAGS